MALYLLIKEHKHGSGEIIGPLPPGSSPSDYEEIWAKQAARWTLNGEPPAHSWMAHEGDIVSAMIASARL